MISVADTGIGIIKEDIPKLFNYFTQLENYLTKKHKGTGLGLAISKRLIELMNGEISVESEYGKGSTFYFTIQVDVPDKNCNEQEQRQTFEKEARLSFLIVEDDYVNQLVMKRLCSNKGWLTQVATNGREALELLSKEKYDLILLDIQMPEMSGFDVIRVIRENEKISGGHTYVIATTAYAMSQDKQRCLEAGMDDYISKPIDFQKFYGLVEKNMKVISSCNSVESRLKS